jgi:hypothetical protein
MVPGGNEPLKTPETQSECEMGVVIIRRCGDKLLENDNAFLITLSVKKSPTQSFKDGR